MRYLAVACSYDETAASDGRIDPATVAGLRRLVASGRHLILVSRRRVEDLLEVLPENLFAWIVAEHGGVLYDPARRAGRSLADPLPDKLVGALQERGVEPLAIGEVSVATDQAVKDALGQAIEATGIDAGAVADKGMAVAVPAGVDKASATSWWPTTWPRSSRGWPAGGCCSATPTTASWQCRPMAPTCCWPAPRVRASRHWRPGCWSDYAITATSSWS
jgi:hypothetical protein